MTAGQNHLGRQIILDLYECDEQFLDDCDRIKSIMEEAAILSGATIVKSVFHQFSPHGISGTVIIKESHLAIHIWPEHRYCAVDLFTCGCKIDAGKAAAVLKKALGAKRISMFEVNRGTLENFMIKD